MGGQGLRAEVERLFAVPDAAGPSKVVSLREAIATVVRPGMCVHLSVSHHRPTALLFELCRQFWGKDPGFTLTCIGFRENGTVPIAGGLVRRLVSPIYFDLYPTPAPNPVFQAARREGRVELENWSMLTLPLRLLAGAMGLPFLPTRSLSGSSMADEHPGAFATIDDPFGGGRIGVVKALQPDVAFVHALAADCWGNALLTPPLGETWGMLAAREGIVLSAERIVPTEVIRRHSHLARVPGHRVRAVVEAPLGAHPGGVFAEMVDGFDTYGEDYEFQQDYRKATRDPAAFSVWIEKWVLGCADHAGYVGQLGAGRIAELRRRGATSAWSEGLEEALASVDLSRPPTPAETAGALAVRLIAERVRQGEHAMILAGVGLPHLAAWVAGQALLREGVPVQLALETGMVGYQARPGDPFIFNFGNLHTATSLTDILHVLGIYVGGPATRCLGVLGIGQIDRLGNLNTTYTGDGTYLVGSGGANDVASAAEECLAVGVLAPQRFLERVPYTTSPGRGIRRVVTDLGILEQPEGTSGLRLTGCLATGDQPLDALVRECRRRCGWDLEVAPEVRVLPPPTPEELLPLRVLDPRGWFLG